MFFNFFAHTQNRICLDRVVVVEYLFVEEGSPKIPLIL